MYRRSLRLIVLTLTTAALAVALAATLFVGSGVYDVSADRPHTQTVYSLLEMTLRQSVRRRAAGIEEPDLAVPALLARGASCFREHCVVCHGAPGVAPSPMGLVMQPLPGPLVDAAFNWRARELVWITRHGIRMSGMPAWGQRLDDKDIWALAAFMLQLPAMSTADYARLSQEQPQDDCSQTMHDRAAQPAATARVLRVEVVDRPLADNAAMRRLGRIALQRHACHGCHVIPGMVGSPRHIGPSLAGYGLRTTIKGHLPNTTENLLAWIRDPQGIDPGSAMPTTRIGEADAHAIVAYLQGLR